MFYQWCHKDDKFELILGNSQVETPTSCFICVFTIMSNCLISCKQYTRWKRHLWAWHNASFKMGCFHSNQQKKRKLTIQVWFSTFFLILGAALTTRCIVVESSPSSLDATTRYSPASALVTFLITKDMLSSSSCRNLQRQVDNYIKFR